MNTSSTVWIATLSVVALAIGLLAYYTYKLPKPQPGNCAVLKDNNPDVKWGDGCSYIQEIAPDSSITSPKSVMYLTSFTASPSLGPAWGINVWYAYRYVNGKTGGYSSLSPWTTTPIHSGASGSILPCKGSGSENGVCSSSFKNSGRDSCGSNLAELQVDGLAYGLGSDYYINVHRYVSEANTQPTPSTPGKVVGMLIQSSNGSGQFIDISENPCSEASCKAVPGC